MLYRLSTNAAKKLDLRRPQCTGLCAENRFCEWVVDTIILNRKHYYLVVNAYSTYGVVIPAKGLKSIEDLNERFLEALKNQLERDGINDVFEAEIKPFSEKVSVEGTHDLRLRSAMNVRRRDLDFASDRTDEEEKFNRVICDNFTSAFSLDREYQHVTKELFNDRKHMALPAIPAPPKLPKQPVTAIRLYVEMVGFEKRVWRRFLIMGDAKMSTLGYALLAMLNTLSYHLMNFEVTETMFSDEFIEQERVKNPKIGFEKYSELMKKSPSVMIEFPDPDGNLNVDYDYVDAKKAPISVYLTETSKCKFRYDFGDDWEFRIKYEAVVVTDEISAKNPVKILEGKGLGIIEDCGGIGGLGNLLKVFKEKSGEEYEALCEWLGERTLDFDSFDIDSVNRNMKTEIRKNKNAYENWNNDY